MHDATDLVQVLVRLLERLSFRCNVAVVERVVPTSTDVVKGGIPVAYENQSVVQSRCSPTAHVHRS